MIEKFVPLLAKDKFMNRTTKLMAFYGRTSNFSKLKLRSQIKDNAEKYNERKKRILDAIFMERSPDRVPVIGNGINFFPAKYAGITCEQYMCDWKLLKSSNIKIMEDFDLDMFFVPWLFGIGNLLKASGLNLIKMPGRDIDVNSGYQFNEEDRLKAEEYDEFLKDPVKFALNTIGPRCITLPDGKKMPMFKTMREAKKVFHHIFQMDSLMKAHGAYTIFGAFGFPPYDLMSFILRTIQSLSKDLMKKDLRQKVLDIMDWMTPYVTSLFSSIANITGNPGVWFTSERAFSLSPKQFEQFYWPALQKMILAFVKKGLIPFLTIESDVTHLVHYLKELPKDVARRCVFNCDTTDIIKAHKILDGHMCIAGNIPLSIMCVGTPNDVKDYCDKIFPELKGTGGFLLSPALGIPDEAKPENVHAVIEYAHKYGQY